MLVSRTLYILIVLRSTPCKNGSFSLSRFLLEPVLSLCQSRIMTGYAVLRTEYSVRILRNSTRNT
jgi:hypothetical protein